MNLSSSLRIAALTVMTFGVTGSLYAQNMAVGTDAPAAAVSPEATPDQTSLQQPAAQQPEQNKDPSKPIFNADEYTSLVFTHWEHVAIKDAVKYRGKTRGVTEAELMRDLKKREDQAEKVKPPPEEREIRLSGIVYHGGKDWTIWLNEQRVTPDAIPEEVMDLKVYKTYIEFKWFDDYTNQIFPIRLRPHQRFNIDTRIFLPG